MRWTPERGAVARPARALNRYLPCIAPAESPARSMPILASRQLRELVRSRCAERPIYGRPWRTARKVVAICPRRGSTHTHPETASTVWRVRAVDLAGVRACQALATEIVPRMFRIMASEGPGSGFTARRSYPRLSPLTSAYAVQGGISGYRRPLCVHRVWISGSCWPRTGAENSRDGPVGVVTLTAWFMAFAPRAATHHRQGTQPLPTSAEF
jgi:hypothetical protein